MRRAALVALALSLSCNFAVKHPAITTGIVAGSVGFVTCELAAEDHQKCAIAGGAVGLGLALVAGGALWLGSEDEEPAKAEPPPRIDWSKVPDTTPKQPTRPPPDAAVPAVTPDAGAPAPADAGVLSEPAAHGDAGAAVDAK